MVIYDMPDRKTIVKVIVNMSINAPIRPIMYIRSKNNGVDWIYFHYEKIPLLCFYCGYTRHSEDHCKK